MILEIENSFIADLESETNSPIDLTYFKVLISIYLREKDNPGSELFYLTVCSSNTLASIPSGQFILNTLVLEKFNWDNINDRIQKLLMHCQSCVTWNEVILRLTGFLQYAD